MFRSRPQQVSMFVLGGWLFADLFIGLALIFMVGNTQNVPIIQPTPTATLAPTPTPTPQPPPSIDPKDLIIQFSVPNPDVTIGGDHTATQALLGKIENQLSTHGDHGRRVGIVLVYSGTNDALAQAVAAALPSAGREFQSAIYREYFITGAPVSTLKLDVFFFL